MATQQDTSFAQAATQSNLTEIAEGTLAQSRATPLAVDEFGRWMVTDHTMQTGLLQLSATALGITLPTAPTAAQQSEIAALSALSGTPFSLQYLANQVADHDQTAALLTQEIQSGSDPTLIANAALALPAVQQHDLEARILSAALGGGAAVAATPVTIPALTSPTGPAAAGVSAQDQLWVTQAVQSNLTESTEGNLAITKSGSLAAGEYGRWMATDHVMANTLLSVGATALNIPFATAPNAAQQAEITQLSALSDPTFTLQYVAGEVRSHEETIANSLREVQSGTNAGVRTLAQTLLPGITQHLAEAMILTGAQANSAGSVTPTELIPAALAAGGIAALDVAASNRTLQIAAQSAGAAPALAAGMTGLYLVDTANSAATVPSGYGAVLDYAMGPTTLSAGTGTTSVLGGNGGLTLLAGAGSSGTLVAGSGANAFAAAATGAGNWGIWFEAGNNVVLAQSGNDTVSAGTGNNIVALGSGSDLVYSSGKDAILGGAGASTVVGTGTGTLIAGGAGRMTLLDSGSGTVLFAGSGSATVSGGTGGGLYAGGSGGNNLIFAGTGANTVFGGGSGDLLVANGSSQVIVAGVGNETLTGATETGGNVFYGGSAAAGSTQITGGAGNDVIFAGLGRETLAGGGGADLFAFAAGRGGGTDVIADFNAAAGDRVTLQGYGANAAGQALAGASVGAGGTTVSLTDGTQILFAGVTNLSASNFA